MKGANFRPNVVGSVAGLDVLVVRAAVEDGAAFQIGGAGVGVVGNLVCLKNEVTEIDLDLAPEVIHGALLLLFDGADGDLFVQLAGGS